MGKKPSNTARRNNNPRKQGSAKTGFTGNWDQFWRFAGPVITLYFLWQNLYPIVSITSGHNLDSSQTFATRFVVTNTGNVEVSDLSFSCILVGNSANIGILTTGAELTPVKVIPRNGGNASRGCFSRSDIDGALLKVEVHFSSWTLLGFQKTAFQYFSAKKGANGHELEPEAQPENMSELIRVNGPSFTH